MLTITRKNRKADFYLPMLAMFILALVAIIVVALLPKTLNLPSRQIGVRQFEMLTARIESQKAIDYLSLSAEKASSQALYELAQNGGLATSACGDIEGIPLWKSADKKCYPDEQAVQERFRQLMNVYHDRYLAQYKYAVMPLNNMEYKLDRDSGILSVTARKPVQVSIVLSGYAVADAQAYQGSLQAFPVNGEVSFSNDWGYCRENVPGKPCTGTHEGTDILPKDGKEGAPVLNAVSGKLYAHGCNTLGGNFAEVLDEQGAIYYYAHLKSFSDKATSRGTVAAGEKLGEVGTTIGCSTGCNPKEAECGIPGMTVPHLHFGIYPDGVISKNPYYALKAAKDKSFITPGAVAAPIVSGTYSIAPSLTIRTGDFVADYVTLAATAQKLAECMEGPEYALCSQTFNGDHDGLTWNIGCGKGIKFGGWGASR